MSLADELEEEEEEEEDQVPASIFCSSLSPLEVTTLSAAVDKGKYVLPLYFESIHL